MSKLRGSSRTTPSPVATDENGVASAFERLSAAPAGDLASLAQALDALLDPVALLRPVYDDDMRVVDFAYVAANQAALAYLHATRDELVGTGMRAKQNAKDFGLFAMHEHAFETGDPLILTDFTFPNVVTGAIEHYDIRETRVGEVLCFSWRDVTEREELLDHYRLLAENASDVVFRVDSTFHIEWVSPSVKDLQGYSPEDLVGRPLSDFCHPDDLAGVLALVDDTPAGSKGEVELRVLNSDGTYRWCQLNGRRITETDGEVIYVGSLRDIGADRARREAQAETDRRYRLLAENTSDVVMVSRAGGSILWVSSSVTALVGWRPEDLVGHSFAEFVHADDQALMDEVRGQLERGGTGRLVVRLRTRDGEYHWIWIQVRDVVDPVTGERERVASWRDAQEEVASRAALKESELHFRLLAENASDVVWRTDVQGVIEWVSPSVEAVLGYRPDQLVGTSVLDRVHPDQRDEVLADRGTIMAGGTVPIREIRHLAADGTYRWHSVHRRALHDDDGNVVAIVAGIRDETSLVESRRSLAASEARFRLLAENASDVVMEVDAEHRILWVSPSVEQVLGWKPNSLIGRSAGEYFANGGLDSLRESKSLGDSVRAGELRVRQADGTYRWMAARVKGAADGSPSAPGRVVSLRDIAAEVEARETMIASESRFRLLAENATDIVIETDVETRMRWVSPSVLRMLGWRPDEWIGHDPLEFIHEDDAAAVMRHRETALRGERDAPLEIRFRDTEGGYHWMSGQDHLVRGRNTEIITRVIGLRSIDAEVAALQSMTHAESQYQMLAENASDIVMQIAPDSSITWVSPSVTQVLGWEPRDIVGSATWEFLYDEDRERVSALRRLFFMGETVTSFEIRATTPSGDIRWLSMRPRAVRDQNGTITATVMAVRDVQTEVLARRAITTLSAGSRAVIRAQNELDLLNDMCEIAAGKDGYGLAWYARKVHDEAGSVTKVAVSQKNRDYLDQIEVSWNDNPLGQGPVGRAIRLDETVVMGDFRNDVRFAPWLKPALEHGLHTAVSLPVTVGGEVDGALLVYATEADAFDESAVRVLESLAAELGFGLNRLREQEHLLKALNDQKLLSSAIEQATESVMILDPTFTILYANPSTSRTSGYSMDEIIGGKPTMFGSGRATPQYLDNITLALNSGEAWHGTFVNRRKSGELYEEDTTISPVHDEGGRLVAYVEVKSDLTNEMLLRSDLSRTRTDQSSLIEVMRAVRPAASLHPTAYRFCEAAAQLPGVDVAGVLLIQDDLTLLPISVIGTDIFDVDEERPIVITDSDFYARLEDGPLTADTDADGWAGNPQIAAALADEGILGVVFTPIRWEGAMIGILALATKSADAAAQMSSRFGYFEEIAAYAGSLIGSQARSFERRSVVRAQIADTIAAKRFRPFFQPMIDLKNDQVVGYEALTRFDDGVAPTDKFLEAHSVGLGPDLEAAVAASALAAAAHLPAEAFVSLNFSPVSLLDGHARSVVSGATRPIVIEITEHDQIDDYAAVRRAARQLTGCVLAVDDAGAGYTSLSHILELRPRYVKLDISLVRDVDSNPARQAMVAGMCHFAQQSGTILVAEGVETPAEADALRELGVALAEGTMLGQGFLFGRPAPVD